MLFENAKSDGDDVELAEGGWLKKDQLVKALSAGVVDAEADDLGSLSCLQHLRDGSRCCTKC